MRKDIVFAALTACSVSVNAGSFEVYSGDAEVLISGIQSNFDSTLFSEFPTLGIKNQATIMSDESGLDIYFDLNINHSVVSEKSRNNQVLAGEIFREDDFVNIDYLEAGAEIGISQSFDLNSSLTAELGLSRAFQHSRLSMNDSLEEVDVETDMLGTNVTAAFEQRIGHFLTLFVEGDYSISGDKIYEYIGGIEFNQNNLSYGVLYKMSGSEGISDNGDMVESENSGISLRLSYGI